MTTPFRISEHAEQAAVIQWCFMNIGRYPELDLIFAVPNGAALGGGKIGGIRMNTLKAEGLRPGVCDLMLPVARGGYHGAFLEMKAIGGRLSDNQREFIAGVEAQGYWTAVCYGADEAIEQIEFYLAMEKGTS